MTLSTAKKLEKINADPTLWLKNFVKIVDNEGKYVPFIVNQQQKEFLEYRTRYNLIAKSRQLGMSTLMLGLFLYMALTKARTNYLIVSYKLESSTILFERLKAMNDSIPRDKFKFSKIKHSNKNKLSFENGSTITLSVAGNKDVARGGNFLGVHLSELAFYSNQEKLLLSVEQALSKSEEAILTVESTSNGFNHFQKLATSAEKGLSKYKLFFFPWYSKATAQQFKIEIDEAVAWYKASMKELLSEKDLNNEEKLLFEKGATLRLLMWRQFKKLDMSDRDFKQEFPSNLHESFISTGFSVFDQSKVSERLNHLPKKIEYSAVSLHLQQELLSLVSNGSLFVYDLPRKNAKYYFGVDVAGGSGGDNSTISVLDDEGKQVARFKDNRTPVYRFAKIINELGRLYNYAFLVIERNSFGTPLLEKLRREYLYMNIYKMKLFDQQTGRKRMKLGWSTTTSNKATLISDLKEAFELDEILVNDRDTLEEMQIFQESNGKTGNMNGQGLHDDLVIALALATQGKKAKKWYV